MERSGRRVKVEHTEERDTRTRRVKEKHSITANSTTKAWFVLVTTVTDPQELLIVPLL